MKSLAAVVFWVVFKREVGVTKIFKVTDARVYLGLVSVFFDIIKKWVQSTSHVHGTVCT